MINTESSKIICPQGGDGIDVGLCPQAGVCGGCMYQGVPYEKQLEAKLFEARKAVQAAGFDPELVCEIKACQARFFYRNKMEFTFGNANKGAELELGMHKKGSFISIVDASCCQIVPKDFTEILKLTKEFVREKGYEFYSKKFHTGLMRSLVLRAGIRTGEILVNIVTASTSRPEGQDVHASEFRPEGRKMQGAGFDEEDYLKAVLDAEKDGKFEGKIVGVIHTINDNPSDVVTPEQICVLYGRDYYNEKIMGLDFKVGAFSFFQTNVDAAERLYTDALGLIPGIEGKTVYDLYCGTGTISQAMALKAKKVIGVEIVEDAVKSARANAELNGLNNCEFIASDVELALSKITEKPDVIVVDPPRSGIMPKALKQILGYGVKEILYISCNPKTLAENLRAAALCGYKFEKITAYDNFPFTGHIESVVLLSKICNSD